MIEAAVREEVDRRGLFGDTHRAVHPHQDDASADANGFRARSRRRGNRARAGHVAVIDEVVLAHPHVVEAEVLREAGQIELLAIHVRPRPAVPRRVAVGVEQGECGANRTLRFSCPASRGDCSVPDSIDVDWLQCARSQGTYYTVEITLQAFAHRRPNWRLRIVSCAPLHHRGE